MNELYRALIRERYFAPRLAPAGTDLAGASRHSGIPDQHQTVRAVLEYADTGWTADQIAATTGLNPQRVRAVLERHRPPAPESETDDHDDPA